MPCIRFHIGAHKTATTHLQMTLARCRLESGTRHIGLGWLRRTLTSPVRKHRPRLPWHCWYRGTWLFSDENILGTCKEGLALYPDPASALAYFGDCGLRIFLCVRSYDTFLVSAWGERLWHHRFEPFRAELPQRRWTHVVSDIRAKLPDVPVHVWRYEDYRQSAREIAQYFAGGAIAAFGPELEADPKSGFSAEAVEQMDRYRGSRLGKTRIHRLRERYPVGERFERYDPWSAEQKAQLRRMYAEDVERLGEMAEIWRPDPVIQSPR